MNTEHLLILIPLVAAWLVLWVAAFRSVTRHTDLSVAARSLWVVITVGFPVLGPILWSTVAGSRSALK